MTRVFGFLWLIATILWSTTTQVGAETDTLVIKMPSVTTTTDDSYLCTHIHLKKRINIIEFEPSADMHIAHHMLLFKCKRPLNSHKKSYPCGMGCYGEEIIYAWARQAKGLKLPKNVAFEAGEGTGFDYIALQVHYLKSMKIPDASGVTMTLVNRPQPGIAGVVLFTSNDETIPGHSRSVKLPFACQVASKTTIHPFAFRTHAHTLGRTIFAYRFPHDEKTEPSLIGRASPQWPQAFYPVNSSNPIKFKDIIVGACIYDSSKRSRNTYIGGTHNDEMCNFYLMFYFDRKHKINFDEWELCSDGVHINSHRFKKLFNMVPKNILKYLPVTLPSVKTDHFNILPRKWSLKYTKLGQVSGVSVDTKGRLFVFHRGDRTWDANTFTYQNELRSEFKKPIEDPTILIVDPKSGNVIESFGENTFCMPHGITIDSENNVWVTDVGLHQVFKYKYGNWKKHVMEIGTKFTPGSGPNYFCKPADVAILNNGEFLVSDGYCNSRIARFSPSGKYLGEFKSSEGNFEIPHSLTLVNNSVVCAADRERAQIECFSTKSGKSIHTIKDVPEFGDAVYAIAASTWKGQPVIHGVVRRDSDEGPKGFTVSMKNNQILSHWGNDLKLPHDVTISSGYIYVAELERPFRVSAYLDSSYNFSTISTKTNVSVTDHGINDSQILEKKQSWNGVVTPSTGHSSPETYNDTFTVSVSKGFMSLISDNTPLVIGLAIVTPLIIIVFGAAIVHIHRSGVCPCACCRRHRSRFRRDRERGRFQPLLNEDSDGEETLMDRANYNIPSIKKPDLKT